MQLIFTECRSECICKGAFNFCCISGQDWFPSTKLEWSKGCHNKWLKLQPRMSVTQCCSAHNPSTFTRPSFLGYIRKEEEPLFQLDDTRGHRDNFPGQIKPALETDSASSVMQSDFVTPENTSFRSYVMLYIFKVLHKW